MARDYNYSAVDGDLRKLLRKVTDAVIDDTDVALYREWADNLIDSALAFKYDVPFTTTPPIVRIISILLTASYITDILYQKSTTEPEENWASKWEKKGQALLDGIVKGKYILIDSSGGDISPKSDFGIVSNTEDYTPTFNLDDDSTWTVDSDRITDEAT